MTNMFTQEVKAAVVGRWDTVLRALAGGALDAALDHAGRHVLCPFHQADGDRKKKFRADKNVAQTGRFICTCGHWDGFGILQQLYGWNFRETRDQVALQLGFQLDARTGQVHKPSYQRLPPKAPEPPRQDPERLMASLRQRWAESFPLWAVEAEVGRCYLYGRGIRSSVLGGLHDVLRFHPALPYYEDGKKVCDAPALLGKFSDPGGASVTLHRIYLTPEGKNLKDQDGVSAKKLMPKPDEMPLTGGAIRLGPPGPVLGIAEGIETALSVYTATGYVCWSAFSANLLEQFQPPAGVQELLIWADNDVKSGTGLRVAKLLKQRMWEQNVICSIMMPPLPQHPVGKGWDWNDTLVSMGVAGFPNIAYWREQAYRHWQSQPHHNTTEPLSAAG